MPTVAAPPGPNRQSAVDRAVRTLRSGRTVLLPGDDGYVLCADAFSAAGADRLRAAKGLAEDVSLGVQVGRRSTLDGIAYGLTPTGRRLVDRFWPGPLTLLVSAQPSLAWAVGVGRFAVRMPTAPLLLQVLRATGPLVVSAIGGPGRYRLAEALDQLGQPPALALDTGELAPGPALALVDVSGGQPVVHRPGSIGEEALQDVLTPATEDAMTTGGETA